MSEHFMNRNGVVEQVRYYRRQPEYLKHLPWEFELKQQKTKHIVIETLIYSSVAVLVVSIFVAVYF